MAESFGEFALPDFKEDPFLKLIERKHMVDMQGSVLDVGCGAGKYGFAVAGRCRRVTGMNLSPG